VERMEFIWGSSLDRPLGFIGGQRGLVRREF
jgi:hypothetical protein